MSAPGFRTEYLCQWVDALAPLRCSTCGQEITDRDPPADMELEPLLSGHCRFCRQAADFARFIGARTHRGGAEFQPWQLLLSRWLRLKEG